MSYNGTTQSQTSSSSAKAKFRPLDNLVLNGGFQDNNPLSGWASAPGTVALNWQTGSNGVRLMTGGQGLSQKIETTSGQSYILTFDAMQYVTGDSYYGSQWSSHDDLRVFWNGEMVAFLQSDLVSYETLRTFTFEVWGTGQVGGDTLSFQRFRGLDSNTIVGPVIDNIALTTAAATPNEMLVNGSFELNSTGEGGGWQGAFNRVAGEGDRQTADGTKMVQLDSTRGVDAITQTIKTNAGQQYTLTLEAAQDSFTFRNGSLAAAQVIWNGQVIGTIIPDMDVLNYDPRPIWREYNFTVTGTGRAQGDTLSFREVETHSNSTADLVGILIDDVSLTYVPSASAELITNGSFEDGTKYGIQFPTVVNGWKSAFANPGYIEVRTDWGMPSAYSGRSAVHLDSTGQLDTLDQRVQTLKGYNYTLSFSIAADKFASSGAEGREGIEIWWNNQFIQKVNPSVSGWQQVTLDLVGAGDAQGDLLSFRESVNESANQRGALIDMVSLRAKASISETASNVVQGGNGNENLVGGAGNDTIRGVGGNDFLMGGAGNDTLIGGDGNDVLFGGKGADTFVFAGSGRDTILDFSRSQGDKIDLQAYSKGLIMTGSGLNVDFSWGNLPLDSFIQSHANDKGTELWIAKSDEWGDRHFEHQNAVILDNVYWTQSDLGSLVNQGILII